MTTYRPVDAKVDLPALELRVLAFWKKRDLFRRSIERFGVAAFVQRCRESVIRYVDDWKLVSERMGHWIDMDDAYWTMDASYVQSVWWALKQLFDRDLLYRDDRTVAYCPRCGTG